MVRNYKRLKDPSSYFKEDMDNAVQARVKGHRGVKSQAMGRPTAIPYAEDPKLAKYLLLSYAPEETDSLSSLNNIPAIPILNSRNETFEELLLQHVKQSPKLQSRRKGIRGGAVVIALLDAVTYSNEEMTNEENFKELLKGSDEYAPEEDLREMTEEQDYIEIISSNVSTSEITPSFEVIHFLAKRLKKNSDAVEFPYQASNAVKKVFTDQPEKELLNYIIRASQWCFGVTLGETLKLAHQFAKADRLKYTARLDKDEKARRQ
ncbi:hypothetical protein ILUMI_25896 [Ignelater luminosus]|uniref:Uncharacterized protein n=1 Tax=Ignelater luminosus TaxID=2038154 RepID=A0A8K0FZG8_IGNLU|nr:hypothetical protein ILUMI_25896 [Ignelater luminosus]